MTQSLTIVNNTETNRQEVTLASIACPLSKKREKTVFKKLWIRLKVFFWSVSPMHWFDDFKVMKIHMNEFMCKKNNTDIKK